MCGIFGIIVKPDAEVSFDDARAVLDRLYLLSESRGKESAGLHVYLPDKAEDWTLKGAVSAHEFIHSPEYRRYFDKFRSINYAESESSPSSSYIWMAHSRLVTNGVAEKSANNQPVRSDGVTLVHNGIVVNVDALWSRHSDLHRQAEVDTEVLAALISKSLRQGQGPVNATCHAFGEIEGAASIAWVSESGTYSVLATNTGDLYCYRDVDRGMVVFASELFILERALQPLGERKVDISSNARWIKSGGGRLIDLDTLEVVDFSLAEKLDSESRGAADKDSRRNHHEMVVGPEKPQPIVLRQADETLAKYNPAALEALRRCSRCVLPETFPFISFDDEGVCNYCRNYRPRYLDLDPNQAKKNFISMVQKYRGDGNSPDVIVPFSGGRDSSYGLHLVKTEFGLTPTTFTYDWGMVTDLARRNTARLCGALGVQNILVSADIKTKRENIRKNVSAWLRRPELGMVPLFMAGDKHFFSVVNQIKSQTGIKLDLWSANPLENTDFKSGFCNIAPDFGKSRIDYLSFGRKIRLATYYGMNFLRNPGYLNSSMLDTMRAYFAYYFEPRRDFFFIFEHMVWNEDEVNRVLIDEYDFELSPDSSSSWRIGDGTAPFYNYIYVTARGFSEFDTFRSNQIREGMITREQAMQNVVAENRPRLESLRWYLDVIGMDFNQVIREVNKLDVLGLHG